MAGLEFRFTTTENSKFLRINVSTPYETHFPLSSSEGSRLIQTRQSEVNFPLSSSELNTLLFSTREGEKNAVLSSTEYNVAINSIDGEKNILINVGDNLENRFYPQLKLLSSGGYIALIDSTGLFAGDNANGYLDEWHPANKSIYLVGWKWNGPSVTINNNLADSGQIQRVWEASEFTLEEHGLYVFILLVTSKQNNVLQLPLSEQGPKLAALLTNSYDSRISSPLVYAHIPDIYLGYRKLLLSNSCSKKLKELNSLLYALDRLTDKGLAQEAFTLLDVIKHTWYS